MRTPMACRRRAPPAFRLPRAASTTCCSNRRRLPLRWPSARRLKAGATDEYATRRHAPIRAEVEYDLPPLPAQTAQTPLPWQERLWRHAALRKTFILVLLACVWELAARYTDNDLLLPGAWQTAQAFAQGIANGELLARAGQSLRVLVQGYLAGVVLAFVLTTLAVSTRFGRDLLSTLTAMFNPLPAIALLPWRCCGSAWAKAAWCSC